MDPVSKLRQTSQAAFAASSFSSWFKSFYAFSTMKNTSSAIIIVESKSEYNLYLSKYNITY